MGVEGFRVNLTPLGSTTMKAIGKNLKLQQRQELLRGMRQSIKLATQQGHYQILAK